MERVTAHGEAVMELREAIGYYESKSPGLGRRFFDEVNGFIRRILECPTQFPNAWLESVGRTCAAFPFM